MNISDKLCGQCTHCGRRDVSIDVEFGTCLLDVDNCNSYAICKYGMPNETLIIKRIKINQRSSGKAAVKSNAPEGYLTWGVISNSLNYEETLEKITDEDIIRDFYIDPKD